MFRAFITHFFLFLVLLPYWVESKVVDDGCALQLMPCPKSVNVLDGQFMLGKQVNIYVEGMSVSRQEAALSHHTEKLSRLENFDFEHFNILKSKEDSNVIVMVNTALDDQVDARGVYHFPRLDDDESYQLSITQNAILIESMSEFGALHGLTTLTQLIYAADSAAQRVNNSNPLSLTNLSLPQVIIDDDPEFAWRGLLIDSVRHFIPVSAIKRQLDGMASAKLNVFHWHLNDDQGWRIESKRHPKLHQVASDNLYYTQQEIKDVVAYASLLGIRVVPELDIPGHATSIAVAYPELIAEKKNYVMQRQWGVFEPVLDVSDVKVYQFIDDLVAEFSLLFPDSYIHIGGDEVNPVQWLNNPNIQTLMKEESLANSADIQHYFNLKIQKILAKHQRKMMGWDEIYHPDLPKDIIIQSWRGLESMNRFANSGYQGVLSTGFYIDQPQYSAYHYRNHPISNLGAKTARSLDSNLPNLESGSKGQFRTWELTIPRLKGSAVTGRFILFNQTNIDKKLNLTGYLKLNNNAFQKVSIERPVGGINSKILAFSADSWMGPLLFELDLSVANSGFDLNREKAATISESPANNRLFIGNAFYPFIAREFDHATANDISFAPPIKPENTKNIVGGEATLWSELVTQHNIDLRMWPRLYVIAERLWSPPQLNDVNNMYERLFLIEKYAEEIIGLQHKKQQLEGFSELLGNDSTSEYIAALIQLAKLVEPAHYYTRHHLKYRQGEYHQQAALDEFVDFLAVESFELIKLNKLISVYQNGNESALSEIKSIVKEWQDNDIQLRRIVLKKPKLSGLVSLIKDVQAFNDAAENTLNACLNSNQQLSESHAFAPLSQKFKQLQERQNETVIAGIPLFQKLLNFCQVRSH